MKDTRGKYIEGKHGLAKRQMIREGGREELRNWKDQGLREWAKRNGSKKEMRRSEEIK